MSEASTNQAPATEPAAQAPAAPSRRKMLTADIGNTPQAQMAKGSLAFFGGGGIPDQRHEANFPLAKLTPSKKNPRRLSLDMAGVTPETIAEYRKRPDESIDEWMLRQDTFLDQLKKREEFDKYTVWHDLFDLAVSTIPVGLLQPIVATLEGVIIGGERRYTACLLAGHETAGVILRHMPEDMQDIFRLIENIKRTDLTVAETCLAVRALMETLTGTKLGPDNNLVTVDLLKTTLNIKQTQAYYFNTICTLESGDEMLEQVMAGQFTSLRTAYTEVAEYLRRKRRGAVQGALVGTGGQQPENPAPQRSPAPKKPSSPVVKLPLPGTVSGKRFISALSTIEGLSEGTSSSLGTLLGDWEKLNDKMRREKLSAAMAQVLESLLPLDTDIDGGGQ